MNEYILDKMPNNLIGHINLTLATPPITEADKVRRILKFIQFHDDDVQYIFAEINLREPYQGYRQFRLLARVSWNKTGFSPGYLICKKVEGNYIILEIQNNDPVALLNAFEATVPCRRISGYKESPLEKRHWDNLSLYVSDKITTEFYARQNKTSAQLLHASILENQSKNPIVLDLGCGTGKIYEEFSKLPQAHVQAKWVGVDYSQANIDQAKSRSGCPATWIQHDATYFIDKIEKETFKDADIYVNASGLMNIQVLSFEQSLQIMQSLKKLDNIKMLFITGMTASYISPYLAKQIGFERVSRGVPIFGSDYIYEIACYVPQTVSNRVDRYIAKAIKHRVLDLSYISDHDIDSVIQEILKRKNELIQVRSLLLAAVTLSTSRINSLNHLLDQNKDLLVYVAAINNHQKESIDLAIRVSPYSLRFMSMEAITAYPLFSPTFYRKLGLSKGNDLPMISSGYKDSLDCNRYIGFRGLMLEQLFRALNTDYHAKCELNDNQHAALKAIHFMINDWPVTQDVDNHEKHYSQPLLQAYQSYKALSPSHNKEWLMNTHGQLRPHQNDEFMSDASIPNLETHEAKKMALYLYQTGKISPREWEDIIYANPDLNDLFKDETHRHVEKKAKLN